MAYLSPFVVLYTQQSNEIVEHACCHVMNSAKEFVGYFMKHDTLYQMMWLRIDHLMSSLNKAKHFEEYSEVLISTRWF